MKAVIYYTEISPEYEGRRMEHMIGEKLLEAGLFKEFGRQLKFEPRAKGEHGKPFFTLLPGVHYNISHSGRYVMCILAEKEVGIDIQMYKPVNHERMLRRMVPEEMIGEILGAPDMEQRFFDQWALREAYIKWTGQGLSQELSAIPMDKGTGEILSFKENYSCAVWSAEKLELRWEKAEVSLAGL